MGATNKTAAPAKGNKKSEAEKPVDGKSDVPKSKEQEEEDLSEEDAKLKEELDMLVERLTESKTELYPAALDSLTGLIRTSTSSMTAVPKPLKFLKPHYPQLVEVWESWQQSAAKNQLAGILSVLGMTQGTALHHRLLVEDNGDEQELAAWGHEYLRHLALEIGDEYHKRMEADETLEPATGDLLDLALRIVPYFLKHNAETDAVDLLLEVESVERIADEGLMDTETYPRVCQYLVACASYLDTDTATASLQTAFTIYKQNDKLPEALLLAIRLDDEELVRSVFAETQDAPLRKQLAFIVARQRRFYNLTDEETGELPDDIADEIRNKKLSEYYLYLAKELNLEKPKTPYEILHSSGESGVFKVHGERSKMTLATIFVRGLLNAGYSNLAEDFTEIATASSRSRPMNASAVHTSLGLGYLWNYHEALQELDKFIDSDDTATRAGAVLGVGVATTGVHDETDAAMGLLADLVAEASSANSSVGTSAILGLGFAYAGTAREELVELLEPLVTDSSLPIEMSALAAVALGFIFVGSSNGYLTSSILEAFIERDEKDLSNPWAIFMGLGLALLYIGNADKIEAAVETVKAIEHPIAQSIEILLVICAYAGSGNVLQIQRLLRETATRHYEEDEEEEDDEIDSADDSSNAIVAALKKAASGAGEEDQSTTWDHGDPNATQDETQPGGRGGTTDAINEGAEESKGEEKEETNPEEDAATRRESAKAKGLCTLGIGLIAMGENIGEEMVMRHLEHLMHYGDSYIKQAVPLAMGLVSTSNPQMKVYETLSRYTHELQFNVANNAIFALGLVGAGTLNARVAQLLSQLDEFYSRTSELPFMSRFALGLVHLGKGTLTLSPFTAEKQLMSPVSIAGLLTVCIALLMPSSKQFFISEHPSLLYALTLAIQPRMLVTVDENLEPLKVTVRVGQAVDTVGQAGNPKRITGWVTQDTPVLLSAGERAELEDDEYVPLSSTLEGIVILRKREEQI